MKPSKKTLTNKLDKLFSLVIRSVGKCEKCGKKEGQVQLQCAHIYSRRYRHTRHDTLNAVCLCAGCHFWAHQNPIDFTKWIESYLGEGTTNQLREKAHLLTPVSLEEMQDKLKELNILLDN